MKAVQWVELFKKNPLPSTMLAYIQETKSLIWRRGDSPESVEGVIREQANKFNKICAYCEFLDPEIFELELEHKLPEVYKVYLKEVQKKTIKRIARSLNAIYQQQVAEANKYDDPLMRIMIRYAAMMNRDIEMQEVKEMFHQGS